MMVMMVAVWRYDRAMLPVAWLERLFWPLARRYGWDRNYLLGVLNGWFVFLGDGFMNATVVLSSFVAALGAPNIVIGLPGAIQTGGWLLPQLLVASQIRHLPRKVVVYGRASVVRTIAYIWIVASTVIFANNHTLLLLAFLVGLSVNALASGASGLPFMEVVAKTIPAQSRAAFWGVRNLYGGLLALAAGFLVRWLLASEISFPYDYTLIFAGGLVAYSIGYNCFARVDEPPDPPQVRIGFLAELQQIPLTLQKDRAFANFVLVRTIQAISAIAEPFFTAYALRALGAAKGSVGVFLIVLGITAPLSNILWARLATRYGSRRILRLALIVAMLAPIAALLLPKGIGAWFGLVFVLSASATAGLNMGNANYLLGIADPLARGRTIGTINTIVGIASLSPVLAGGLVDLIGGVNGYRLIFLLSAFLFALTFLLSGRLRRDL
jgi:hypothetical protein